ncbi:MAG: flagellar FlbD family protein [Leptospiraceae bacterium]|nr:flagellar FlbD family protein [Leptospiraceae bacterium]MCP5513107.1 flagellar FlbD family protein [Leptospiraceae bacterium]
MIIVHRLNNSEFIINANQIETVESTPDTVITLVNDKKLIVKESIEEVLNAVMAYQRKVYVSAFQAVREGE